MSDSADRTIPATPRRREAACRQGLAPRPHQVAWLAAAVTTLLLLPAWARATLALNPEVNSAPTTSVMKLASRPLQTRRSGPRTAR